MIINVLRQNIGTVGPFVVTCTCSRKAFLASECAKSDGIHLPISEGIFLSTMFRFYPDSGSNSCNLNISKGLARPAYSCQDSGCARLSSPRWPPSAVRYLAKYPVFARTFNPSRLGLITILRKVSSFTSFVG